MTIEMAEILAMLIIEFENKPAKERKELMKQLTEKNKIVMYKFIFYIYLKKHQSVKYNYK